MKQYKVICPKMDLTTPKVCVDNHGLLIQDGPHYQVVKEPPHYAGCKCYLEPTEDFKQSDSIHPANFDHNLPKYDPTFRCASTFCDKCGKPDWSHEGKVGCGNPKCGMYQILVPDFDFSAYYFPQVMKNMIEAYQTKHIDKQVKELTKGDQFQVPPHTQRFLNDKPIIIHCPNINDETPEICVTYNNKKVSHFEGMFLPPHCDECKCYATERNFTEDLNPPTIIEFKSDLSDKQVERIHKHIREITKGGDWKKPIISQDIRFKRVQAKKELKQLHVKQRHLKYNIRKLDQQVSGIRELQKESIASCHRHHTVLSNNPNPRLNTIFADLLSYYALYENVLRRVRAKQRKSVINAKRITDLQLQLKRNFTTVFSG